MEGDHLLNGIQFHMHVVVVNRNCHRHPHICVLFCTSAITAQQLYVELAIVRVDVRCVIAFTKDVRAIVEGGTVVRF